MCQCSNLRTLQESLLAMSSPSLSLRTLSHSSRSSSPHAGSPSTAPSTPSDAPVTYFFVTHSASASFLRRLPARRASNDRILHCTGTGSVKSLLSEAANVLADSSFVIPDFWERVSARDNDTNVTYWCTKSAALDGSVAPDAAADFDKLEAASTLVSKSPWVTVKSKLTLNTATCRKCSEPIHRGQSSLPHRPQIRRISSTCPRTPTLLFPSALTNTRYFCQPQ